MDILSSIVKKVVLLYIEENKFIHSFIHKNPKKDSLPTPVLEIVKQLLPLYHVGPLDEVQRRSIAQVSNQ